MVITHHLDHCTLPRIFHGKLRVFLPQSFPHGKKRNLREKRAFLMDHGGQKVPQMALILWGRVNDTQGSTTSDPLLGVKTTNKKLSLSIRASKPWSFGSLTLHVYCNEFALDSLVHYYCPIHKVSCPSQFPGAGGSLFLGKIRNTILKRIC